MKHEIDIRTNPDSSQAVCTCGWESSPVYNTYIAQRWGRDHLRDCRARPASRSRKYDRGGELPKTGPQLRTLADLIGPGRLEDILAEQRRTADAIRAQKKGEK